MWSGSGGWNQFPIQQSAYANIPSEDVDWASLAKQWIAQRDVMTSAALHDNNSTVSYMSPAAPPPPPPLPPVATVDHQLQQSASINQPGLGGGTGHHHHCENIIADNCNSQDSTDSGVINQVPTVHQPCWDNWGNSGWNIPTWAVPPPPPPDEVDDEHSKGHFQPSESFMPSYEYNQNVNNFYELANSGGYPYWSVPGDQQMQMPPMVARPPSIEYRPAMRRGFVGSAMNVPSLLDDSLLDASKRRQLPAWIREGLEKVEREKLKQIEREKMLQESQNTKKSHETGNDGNKLIGEVLAVKSRFDSDDEDNSDDEVRNANSEPEPAPEPEPEERKVHSPKKKEEIKVMTEEEKQMHFMTRVRQMLTEVLLEVTGSEISDIAYSVYKSAKAKEAKAPAKQLAKSSALASITSLGLGYDTDSEDEDGRPGISSPTPDASNSSDEETFEQRIAQKKKEFERKMSRLEECEREQANIRGSLLKSKFENASLKQEVGCDTQGPVMTVNNTERSIVREGSERNRELCGEVTNVALGSDADNTEQKFKGKLKGEIGRNDTPVESPLSTRYTLQTSHKIKRESSESSGESSSESGASKKKQASRNKELMKSKTSRESHKDGGHSRRKSEEVDKKCDVSKQRYSEKCDDRSEVIDNRLEEQFGSSSEVYSRHRSSHSHDRDGKKSKKKTHESHKRKRTRDADYDEHSKDKNSSSRHKRRHRSDSGSEESEKSRTKSHRRHRSDDKRHRQHSSSTSREEVRRGSYGKKSRGKRKSKSSSRSSDDH